MVSTIESVADEEERKKEMQQAKAERETLFVLPHRHCCLSSPHPPARQPPMLSGCPFCSFHGCDENLSYTSL